ncbi:MAG: SdpI family protein [Lachnospiraceae bacterium]|nr:SdpI family protein [Lachnospiraceae bacterium]
MLKKYRIRIAVTCIVTLLPILIGLLNWDALPQSMAIHFGVNGEADGWSNRYFAVFGLPCFLLAVHLLCVFATFVDPQRQGINSKLLMLVFWICPAVSWFCAALVYANALGIKMDVLKTVDIFMAVMLIGLGNYLPKCRQNYTVGVKLPWTLADADNWNKTNRLAGWLFVAVGFLWIISVFTGGIAAPLAGTILAAVIPTVYSLVIYLRKS